MDFIAGERQFLDHAAPVHRELGGRFLVASNLVDRALSKGIDPEPLDITAIRRADPLPPKARPGSGPLAFATSIGDMKIARRLGYRRFVFMEHGVGQSYLEPSGINHPSYPGGADREDVELFLVPNEYAAAPWRKAYPGARVEVVGSPLLDDLPRRASGPQTIAISFHWPAFVAPEAGTALGHYLAILPKLAERFHVIGHAHPKGDWPTRMERIYRRAGIEFVAEFDEVCRRADAYVCDNSSTIFEFASTGRPVVVLNAPQYRRKVHLGGRFWDWATVGVQVDEPADLIAGIDEALLDAGQAERERVLSLVYQPRTNAAATAASVIRDFLAEREAVAA